MTRNTDFAVEGRTQESLFTGFVVFGLFVPFIASVLLSMSYVWSRNYLFAWQYTLVVLVIIWIVGAFLFRGFTSPERAQASSFLEFRARLDALNAMLTLHDAIRGESRQSALAEAEAYRTAIAKQLGWLPQSSTTAEAGPFSLRRWLSLSNMQWVAGHGYLAIWEKLQRAEEALFLLVTPHEALSWANYDEARIRDSNLKDSDALLYQLNQARHVLVRAHNLT
jgi:hypothetical protein